MTFNTGNPIGSTDARDLSDNAENFDKALGTLDATWTDRLGVTRDSFEGRLAKGSFYRVGTFAAGYKLTNMRQTLEYSGHEYSWAGTFPKVVAAGATPATSGGIGAGAWVDRTDLTLRSELTENGSSIEAISMLPDFVSNFHIFNASNYDVINDQEIDQTAKLNECISDAVAHGARFVQLDYDIHCAGQINNAHNIILIGNGNIDSAYAGNYGISVSSRKNSVITTINQCNKKNAFRSLSPAIQSGTVRVVLVGDSISTLNPDTITSTDSFSYYLETKLKAALSGVTVNFYNRAIGGATMEDLDRASLPAWLQSIAASQAPWYTDYNQPWLSYISSLNPDLVILAFGMNGENTTGLAYDSIDSVYSKISAFAKVPSVAYVTTPVPTSNKNSAIFGTTSSHSLRNHIAEITRCYASTKAYVIDVNRLQQIKCHGIDPVCYHKKESFLLESGVTTESSSPTVFNTRSRYWSANFDLLMSASPLSIQFNFNPAAESTYFNTIVISSGGVTVYTNTTVIKNLTLASTVGVYYNFKVSFDRNRVIILRDDIVILDEFISSFKNLFDAKVLFSGGPTKKNVRFFEFKPERVEKSVTADEAWGVYGTDSGGLKPLIGGNGVNHPSTIGISSFYKPAVDEFISDIPNSLTKRETIYNTAISTGSASLISGKKFSDYSFCIFVFGNDSIGNPMCQVVPKEVIASGYTIQEVQRNSSGTFAGIISVAINSNTSFTISKTGATSNQLGLIIGVV